MIPLPTTEARCHPMHADFWCKQCKRYADQPDQTWAKDTPAWNTSGSDDNKCEYVPIEGQPLKVIEFRNSDR